MRRRQPLAPVDGGAPLAARFGAALARHAAGLRVRELVSELVCAPVNVRPTSSGGGGGGGGGGSIADDEGVPVLSMADLLAGKVEAAPAPAAAAEVRSAPFAALSLDGVVALCGRVADDAAVADRALSAACRCCRGDMHFPLRYAFPSVARMPI